MTPEHRAPPDEVCILGVDPGLGGAIAFYFPSRPNLIVVEDMPVADNEVDAATLGQRIKQMAPTFAVIERVGSMPKQGVSSTFKFGQAYGAARGVISTLGVPTHLVAPIVRKKTLPVIRRQRSITRVGAAVMADERMLRTQERSLAGRKCAPCEIRRRTRNQSTENSCSAGIAHRPPPPVFAEGTY